MTSRDETKIKNIRLTQEQMQKAIERANKNLRMAVTWSDPRTQEQRKKEAR